MTKKLFVLILIVCFTYANSQESDRNKYLTVSIITPGISAAPRWTVGYIHQFAPKWMVGLDFGYGTYDSSINFIKKDDYRNEYVGYKSYEIKPEIYFQTYSKQKLKQYVSLNYSQVKHTSGMVNSWYETDYDKYDFDYADYEHKKFSVGINYNFVILFA